MIYSILQQITLNFDSNLDEYPFVTFIWDTATPNYCGGALLTYSHVLTAAHCVNVPQPRRALTVTFFKSIYLNKRH